MPMAELRLTTALPALSAELTDLLHEDGYPDLVDQVALLSIVDRCRCGDDFCATFYTAPRPGGAYGPGHKTILLSARKGMIILDLVRSEIKCVEVLDRPEVRAPLLEMFP